MEVRYIIKATYLDGDHKGESYYLSKGGYGCNYEGGYCFYSDCYETERAAKMVATKWNKENKTQVEIERRNNERRAAEGKKLFPAIYTPQHYEPFKVEFGN